MLTPHTVAVLVFPNVNAVDVTGPLEVFATARHEDGSPAYNIVTWTLDQLTVTSESKIKLTADGLAPNTQSSQPLADILIVPGGYGVREPATLRALAAWLTQHHHQVQKIASVCTGAYALAEAGLLDGRKVTTHWEYAQDLQSKYPRLHVSSDDLFLQDGKYFSSGGITAGIDLALELVEQDLGSGVAMQVARELVVFLRRTGTQSQFSLPLQMQSAPKGRLGEVCVWAAQNLHKRLTVEELAERASLSSRQFSRQFNKLYNVPPATYIKHLRLDCARTLLDQGSVHTRVAQAVGFQSTDGFRRAFEDRFGISPKEYQQRFQGN